MDPPLLRRLPSAFWSVPYAGSRFPGSPAVTARPGPAAGANCRLFAYEVLRHFGLAPPALRSSDLSADTRATVRVRVTAALPLDLMLFNSADDAFGAHVGVRVGVGRVLHPCAEVGRPAVWEDERFARGSATGSWSASSG